MQKVLYELKRVELVDLKPREGNSGVLVFFEKEGREKVLSLHFDLTNPVDIVNKILVHPSFQQITNGIPEEFVQEITRIILEWIKIPVFVTVKLTITLGIIFLIISVTLYFMKKKALKEEKKNK